tara:strand:- start:409 stop:789 length:381 start_codon:yes stop_codon:yes gene_type:complete
MPYYIHQGVHRITHSDFYYKTPDFDDSRAVEVSWIVETENGRQFATSFGYNADRYVISTMKKSIDGFISATPVYRDEMYGDRIMSRVQVVSNYGFKQAGVNVPEPTAETMIFGGDPLTVQEVAHAA